MLDVLESYNALASFMVTGINNNKGQIDITQKWIDVIKRQYAAGHQICSHTWSHPDLSLMSEHDRRNEMWKNEMALVNIIGVFPTCKFGSWILNKRVLTWRFFLDMRPPYSSCTTECRATMKALGYHIM